MPDKDNPSADEILALAKNMFEMIQGLSDVVGPIIDVIEERERRLDKEREDR